MSGLPERITEFWDAYAASSGGAEKARFYEAFFFSDSEDSANTLAELVLSGAKRATASAVWSFEAEGKRLPVPGDLSLVTDWAGSHDLA